MYCMFSGICGIKQTEKDDLKIQHYWGSQEKIVRRVDMIRTRYIHTWKCHNETN